MEESKNCKVFDEHIKRNVSDRIRKDPLWTEFCQLEQKMLNRTLSKDEQVITRYNELKRHFDIAKSVDALHKAKEKIKQEIIYKDSSTDNSVLYTAITKFDKRND